MQALNTSIQFSSRAAGRGLGSLGRGMSSSRGRGQRDRTQGSGRDGRGRGAARERAGGHGKGRPRLTHFLSIPLGHLPQLCTRVSAFTSPLLANDPPVPGLDESIVIPPRRLHLTLGVMSLAESAPQNSATAPKTLGAALALLTSLRPHVLAILNDQPLKVPLEVLDIMRPPRGGAQNAHVMFAGPNPHAGGEDNRKLRAVCELINTSFIQAGLVEGERRPLKLHCTLLNTTYRKPRARDGRRVPFDFDAILASDAFTQISNPRPVRNTPRRAGVNEDEAASTVAVTGTGTEIEPPSSDSSFPTSRARPPVQRPEPRGAQREHGHRVDLGSYVVNEVQICLMGSCGPEGEYVSVGGITLDGGELGT